MAQLWQRLYGEWVNVYKVKWTKENNWFIKFGEPIYKAKLIGLAVESEGDNEVSLSWIVLKEDNTARVFGTEAIEFRNTKLMPEP